MNKFQIAKKNFYIDMDANWWQPTKLGNFGFSFVFCITCGKHYECPSILYTDTNKIHLLDRAHYCECSRT